MIYRGNTRSSFIRSFDFVRSSCSKQIFGPILDFGSNSHQVLGDIYGVDLTFSPYEVLSAQYGTKLCCGAKRVQFGFFFETRNRVGAALQI